MKLTDYSLDSLHMAATAEFGDDGTRAALLHDIYLDLFQQYVDWFEALREMKESSE
jgi:hypothetical protein